jgi:cell division protein FtsL
MKYGFARPDWLTAEFWQAYMAALQQRLLPRAAPSDQASRIISGGELLLPVLLVTGLTLAVMASAMAVIFSAYEYRRLFNQHQILVHQWDELQVEWGQYLLEQSVWSSHHRVESLAASKLNMVVPDIETIEIVRHEQK